jgi:membrane-associated phospholipid phosphatase
MRLGLPLNDGSRRPRTNLAHGVRCESLGSVGEHGNGSFARRKTRIGRKPVVSYTARGVEVSRIIDESWRDMEHGKTGQDNQLPGGLTNRTSARWYSPVWDVPGSKYWRHLLLPAGALALAGLAALSIDVPLSRWAIAFRYPRALRELLEMSETFGHGVGVAVLALAVFMLDPPRRWAVPRLLMATYGAGLVANIGKMLIARTRPSGFGIAAGDVWQTFEAPFPFGEGGNMHQSFPSAHTATAVAFALVLSCLYPHARRLFMALALLVAMQRLQCGAHYLSDICCGAAIGWLVTVGSFRFTPFTRLMDRLEPRWAGNDAQAKTAHRRAA